MGIAVFCLVVGCLALATFCGMLFVDIEGKNADIVELQSEVKELRQKIKNVQRLLEEEPEDDDASEVD